MESRGILITHHCSFFQENREHSMEAVSFLSCNSNNINNCGNNEGDNNISTQISSESNNNNINIDGQFQQCQLQGQPQGQVVHFKSRGELSNCKKREGGYIYVGRIYLRRKRGKLNMERRLSYYSQGLPCSGLFVFLFIRHAPIEHSFKKYVHRFDLYERVVNTNLVLFNRRMQLMTS